MTELSSPTRRSDTEVAGDRISESFQALRLDIGRDMRRELNRVIFGMIPTCIALIALVFIIALLS